MSFVLTFSIIISLIGCSKKPSSTGLSDPDSQTTVEDLMTETVMTETENSETILSEYITNEVYLEEIILAEDKITELLLEEDSIEEVKMCQTIYVPQDNIDEFSKNSQMAQLFGDEINLGSLLKKVAIGTGVIVTLVVLKKAGLPDPVASVVIAAADESVKFAKTGAIIGSLFGGLTGASNEIDSSGRSSAVIGFATATAGLVLTTVSLVAAIPSGGSTTITAAAGIKLVIAGVGVLAATAGTIASGYEAIKTFTSTDSADIDWNNIDWNKVGVSSAKKAIQNSADGYMWGSIIGAIHGGAEGYDFYQKHGTPYSSYKTRIKKTPIDGEKGKWEAERGESDYILNEPIELKDGTKITRVTYKNGVPDFSPFQKAQVKIPNMTNDRYANFKQADEALAELWSRIKYDNHNWSPRDVATYRTENNLSWHEMNNMESMQLVPYDVNATFLHLGGVGEYNAMVGQEGGDVFD